jgi:hypothetical protein
VFLADVVGGQKNVLFMSDGTRDGTQPATMDEDLEFMRAELIGCGKASMTASCFGGVQPNFRFAVSSHLQLNGYTTESFGVSAQVAFRAGVAASIGIGVNQVLITGVSSAGRRRMGGGRSDGGGRGAKEEQDEAKDAAAETSGASFHLSPPSMEEVEVGIQGIVGVLGSIGDASVFRSSETDAAALASEVGGQRQQQAAADQTSASASPLSSSSSSSSAPRTRRSLLGFTSGAVRVEFKVMASVPAVRDVVVNKLDSFLQSSGSSALVAMLQESGVTEVVSVRATAAPSVESIVSFGAVM